MARTSYILVNPAMEAGFYSALKSSDRFVYSRITRNDTLLSRSKKKGVKTKSLLPQIAAIWNGLTVSEVDAWYSAADKMDLNGWQLFVQDQTLRILNDLPGVATPSDLHQSWVGNIRIASPASSIKIVQFHPHTYWVSRKVIGKKGMYEPVQVVEDFVLPLKISLNYRANLVSSGAGSFAKFYAKIWHRLQGVDLQHVLEVPLELSTGWVYGEATCNELIGQIVGYDLYFELYNLRGDLFFDNIKAEHSGQNWARDPFCKSIDITFTRAFYQIPQNWAAVNLPSGAEYDSVYTDI